MISLLSATEPHARKRHRCSLCDGPIEVGIKHIAESYCDGGAAWTWRAHIDCERLINAYWEWCGYKLSEIDETDQIDPYEFGSFLRQRSDGPVWETQR